VNCDYFPVAKGDPAELFAGISVMWSGSRPLPGRLLKAFFETSELRASQASTGAKGFITSTSRSSGHTFRSAPPRGAADHYPGSTGIS